MLNLFFVQSVFTYQVFKDFLQDKTGSGTNAKRIIFEIIILKWPRSFSSNATVGHKHCSLNVFMKIPTTHSRIC